MRGVRVLDVPDIGDARHQLPNELRRIGKVATARGYQRRAADLAEVRARIVDVVGMRVDPEDAQVRVAAADVRPDQPQRGAGETREPGKRPGTKRGPTLTPTASDEMLDRPVLAFLNVAGHAVRGEAENEALDELGMTNGQPLSVVTAGGNPEHDDGARPPLPDQRGIVVGDVRGRAAGWKVGATADLDHSQVMPLDRLEPAPPP